jgi:hypothetical protein
LELAEWLATRKRIPLPLECKQSRLQWWWWLNSLITRIDREDARAAQVDFRLELDLTDPVSIIGALKYAAKANESNKFDDAKRLILMGAHPLIAQDECALTNDELDEITKDVELNNPEFQIDWGSV